jgi:hypothetical protein
MHRRLSARLRRTSRPRIAETEPHPIYRRPEPRTDRYIELLLTPNEVASILSISNDGITRSWPAFALAARFRGYVGRTTCASDAPAVRCGCTATKL